MEIIVDLTTVKKGDDGSVIVGDENAPVCIDGEVLVELLTKDGVDAALEEKIEELQKQTGFDEIAVGCCLSNYGIKHVCPPITNGWCKDYDKCRVLERIMREETNAVRV